MKSENTGRMRTRHRIGNLVLGSIALILAALVCFASFAPFTPAVFLTPIMLLAAGLFTLFKHVRVAVASGFWCLATVLASPIIVDAAGWLIAGMFLTGIMLSLCMLVDYWHATRFDP